MNTKGKSTIDVIRHLGDLGISTNVTAIMTLKQVENTFDALNPEIVNFVSVFAGRIADTGRDPVPLMMQCLEVLSENPKANLIWASPRELLNIFQANEIGCHVITATSDILGKIQTIGKNLEQYSQETVQMFFDDAQKSGYKI
jgi:transaldolase